MYLRPLIAPGETTGNGCQIACMQMLVLHHVPSDLNTFVEHDSSVNGSPVSTPMPVALVTFGNAFEELARSNLQGCKSAFLQVSHKIS